MAPEVVKNVKAYAPDRIVLLPLYPQYSTTTTRSSLQDWQKACRLEGLHVPSSMVCCYPLGKGFIDASALLVREAVEKARAECGRTPRVLFSAHGLPESIIKEGDPYQWQCEQGASHIAAAAGLKEDEWQICYQSRVGPKKWIAPSADEALHKAAEDKVPVLMYPHAFVSEHVETLVEIEHEYRDLAKKLGIPWFGRVPTVSVQPAFIAGLADMVKASLAREEITSDQQKRLCPSGFSQCCQQEFAKGV
jgi:ferrochelatase